MHRPWLPLCSTWLGCRRWGRLALVASSALLLAAPVASAAPVVTLRLAHRWAPDHSFALGLMNAIEGFQKKYPDLRVELLHAYTDDKYRLEIVAGDPPDVMFLPPPILLSWAVDGLLEPLDSFAKASGVTPRDFFPAAWPQMMWDGKLWAMPLQVDPNFALIWNRTLFSQVGLDPEQGPRTLPEFESYFNKLTRYENSQTLRQIGMVPWDVYGYANTVYTWGWIFGGQFYDQERRQMTADHPGNVAAVTYLRDYYQRYAGAVNALSQGLPSGRNRFTAGRDAMRFNVTGELFQWKKTFPDLDIGVGKMFYHPESGVENPAWLGGWSLAIPRGVKNKEAAWKLVHYLTADPEGTARFGEASGWMPFYVKSPVFRTYFARDPVWRVYLEIATTAANYRPPIPVAQAYATELDQALRAVFAGQLQPRDALQQAGRKVQLELERVLQRRP